jgi:hypothetical protein
MIDGTDLFWIRTGWRQNWFCSRLCFEENHETCFYQPRSNHAIERISRVPDASMITKEQLRND